ncbi:MAG: DUF3413 domain-containing protein, partial [Proteobacteria bacterium]|nr:DUF3413 domain-containing protein [Pseudomonadota bacterium]
MKNIHSPCHEKSQVKDTAESVSHMSESGSINNKKIITLYTIIAFFSFALIYSSYRTGLNTSGLSGGLIFYIDFSFWLHFLTFASVTFLAIYFVERVLARRKNTQLVLFAVAGSLLTIYLYVDSKIYNTMNLHLNRFVIEALAQEDALSMTGISPELLIVAILPVLFFIAVHILISPLSRFTVATITFSRGKVLVYFFILAVIVGMDKLLFSYFYFKAQPFVFQLREAPPAYLVPHPYHINKIYSYLPGGSPKRYFTEPMEGLTGTSEAVHLNYPGNLNLGDFVRVHDFNIVMVVIESLRQQNIDSDTAPFFTGLGRETIRLNNHY